MGIDVDRVILVTFFERPRWRVGRFLFGPGTPPRFLMGYLLGIKAFTAAVIGGIGNIRGAMIGGLLLGRAGKPRGGFITTQFQERSSFWR